MRLVLVSDTSVLLDLHRGSLLDRALTLPYEFGVPDLLFERELQTWDGPSLQGQVTVMTLNPAGVALATAFRRATPALSLPDAFALALAKVHGHTLLAGDARLRSAATANDVACHGVLWVLDELEAHGVAERSDLHDGLTRIAAHPRCRLPRLEIRKRLDRWT